MCARFLMRPLGFDKFPTNGLAGRTEVFEYDSKITGEWELWAFRAFGESASAS